MIKNILIIIVKKKHKILYKTESLNFDNHEDIEQAFDIIKQDGENFDLEFFKSIDHPTIIIRANNKIVGLIQYYIGSTYATKDCEIVFLIIDKQYKRRGCATQLLGSVLVEAKQVGCAFLFVHVDPYNYKAISLYHKFGFDGDFITEKYEATLFYAIK